MKTCTSLLLLCVMASCKKEKAATPEPWNQIHLQAQVTYDGTPSFWKSTVNLNKHAYDSLFVIVQWDAYSMPGAYVETLKDTVTIVPGKSGTIEHLSSISYQYPWLANEVKIVYAWSSVWNKYDLRY